MYGPLPLRHIIRKEKAAESPVLSEMGIFDQNEQMRKLQSDPVGIAKQKGFDIPQDIANDPRAMVMHLINSGQVSSPMLQRIMPMIQKLQGNSVTIR